MLVKSYQWNFEPFSSDICYMLLIMTVMLLYCVHIPNILTLYMWRTIHSAFAQIQLLWRLPCRILLKPWWNSISFHPCNVL